MARNQATLTFAGDSRNLERAFDRVGAAANRMKDNVNRSGSKINIAGAGSELAKNLKNLPSLVGEAFSALPIQAKAPIAAAGAAAALVFAAPIGAAITAAVLLAVGGGVIALGIKAAAADPRVKAAWEPVAASGRSALARLGQHFVGPLERAAGQFKVQVDKLGPMADRVGAAFAPVIDKLAPAFAGMVEKILPPLERAALASVPLFNMLAEKAPLIGDAVARFFNLMADNGPAAEMFLRRIIDLTVFVVNQIVLWINMLAKLYKAGEDLFARWKSSAQVFGNAFDGLWLSFKSNANRIIAAWNRLSFTIGGGNIFGQNIPSFTLSTPNIPMFHQGGVMPGAPGSEGLALLQAGERVIPAGQAGSMTLVVQGGGGSDLDRLMAAWISRLVRTGQLKLVQG